MNAWDPKAFAIAATGGLSSYFKNAGFVGPNQNCFADVSKYLPKHSPAVAKQILQADGYTAGSGGVMQKNGTPLKITLMSSVQHGSAPEYLAQQFQAAGFQVDLQK